MKITRTGKDIHDKVKIVIECNRAAAESLMPLLETLEKMGNIGSSRSITIDDWDHGEDSFGFDGDGPDSIDKITLEDKENE